MTPYVLLQRQYEISSKVYFGRLHFLVYMNHTQLSASLQTVRLLSVSLRGTSVNNCQ